MPRFIARLGALVVSLAACSVDDAGLGGAGSGGAGGGTAGAGGDVGGEGGAGGGLERNGGGVGRGAGRRRKRRERGRGGQARVRRARAPADPASQARGPRARGRPARGWPGSGAAGDGVAGSGAAGRGGEGGGRREPCGACFRCGASGACEPILNSSWKVSCVSAKVNATKPNGQVWDSAYSSPPQNNPDPFCQLETKDGRTLVVSGRHGACSRRPGTRT